MVSIRNQLASSGLNTLVQRTGQARIPTSHGEFTAYSCRDQDGREHIAYVSGDLAETSAPIIRLHSECLTGDALGSLRCDCGSQLTLALEIVGASSGGVVVYLRGHEGRGIGLGHKLQAYHLQDDGLDTVEANEALGFPADDRDYAIGAAILNDLGVTRVRLLSNNPAKTAGLAEYGIDIVEQMPLLGTITPENARYLETKRVRMDHSLKPPQ